MAKERTGTGFSLKDHLFNQDRVKYLADLFHAADERFDGSGFVRHTMKQMLNLELKQRIVLIADTLRDYLATDYPIAAKQIIAALPSPLDPRKTDNDFGDFIFAPLGELVVRNGLEKRHLRQSLTTLKAITQRFSMEDAIRAFINTHTDATMDELKKWSTDSNYHVRRLVSEGTRPMLPWSKRLVIDAATTIPLLDQLHADPTRYVTRSVANHLNDISKSHPQLVLSTLHRWKRKGLQREQELRWIEMHALRTLVKKGDVDALEYLSFHANPRIEVSDFKLKSSKLEPGQSIDFTFILTALRDESLLIDYVINFVKANGKLSPKTHKLKRVSLQKNEQVTINKRHKLRANATTYTLYPGIHYLTLQINGKAFTSHSFELRMER